MKRIALLTLLFAGIASAEETALDPQTTVRVEALRRLEGVDIHANPQLEAAVMKVLDAVRGRSEFVEIVRKFQIKGQDDALLEIAIQSSAEIAGTDATRLLLDFEANELLQKTLTGDIARAMKLAEALGNAKDKRGVALLLPLVTDMKRDPALRQQTVRSLTKTADGATKLLKLAADGELPADLKLTACLELNAAPWPQIKAEASQLLPLPQAANAQTLPPVGELLAIKGDASRGAEIFARKESACSACHTVHGKGRAVGPDLSEIGSKLGKEAMLASILDPSAGISFGFEAFTIRLKSDDEIYGLIVSETEEELVVKDSAGAMSRFKKRDVIERQKQKLSLMPVGLQQTMTAQDLADLLDYLASLKKPNAK